MMGIFRTPPEESADLYPGLVVHDGRVTGSITAGATRLPLWAFVHQVVYHGWDTADIDYDFTNTGLNRSAFAEFLGELLEARGEFARLLLVLANAERQETERFDALPLSDAMNFAAWFEVPAEREPVLAQLRRCVAALEAE